MKSSYLPPFQLEKYLGEREFSTPFMMCGSDMDSLSVKELLTLGGPKSEQSFEDCWLGYTPPKGSEELLQEIGKLYESVEVKNILCFAGAEEGIYCFMNSLLTPSDHVIVVTPCYESLRNIASKICDVTSVPLKSSRDKWELDLELLDKAARSNTKLLVINFPHNPTGAMLSESEQAKVIEIARRVGAYIFSDEVYRLLEASTHSPLPALVDRYERGVSLGVLSKAFGLPGLRVGWIACHDRELLEQMSDLKHYLSICNSAPSEALAVVALQNKATILQRNRALRDENLHLLSSAFETFPTLFDWIPPEGGCVGFPLLHGERSSDEFAERFRKEEGVLVLPGSVFNWPENRLRIGVGRRNLPEVLPRFVRFLERWRKLS
jgi:aspartate/methionine/tyrosine aminotransferase